MRIHSRKSTRRLTRKDRVRRPLCLALWAALTVIIAALAGAAIHTQAATVAAVAAASAWLTAFLCRELGFLRVSASGMEALAVLQPLRDGEVYPLNPATLSPENALTVCQEIIYGRPRRILELGSGSSTVLMARCLERLGGEERQIISLEHTDYWFADSQQKIQRAGLGGIATVLHAPLKQFPDVPAPWYDIDVLPKDAGPFDLVLIDGPEGGSHHPLARYGAFPLLRDRLAPEAVLFFDDGLRDGEKEIIKRWLELDSRLEATFVPSYQGLWVLRWKGTRTA
jgi:predicted O-methyltransferase YrrM